MFAFSVNTTSDAADVNPGDGICQIAIGSDLCTLRAAIQESNTVPGLDTILFSIPGVGPHTIQPTSALSTITDPVFRSWSRSMVV
jgi:CSLREA domain-containing protein